MQHAKRTRTKSRIAVAAGAAFLLLGGTAAVAGAGEARDLQATGAEGSGDIRGAGTPGAVDGEYIVVMKESGETAAAPSQLRSEGTLRALATGLLAKVGADAADVTRVYDSVVKGFAVSVSEERARDLAAEPTVAYVEQNHIERGETTQANATWGLDRVDQRDLPLSNSYDYDTTAADVTAYVVDSGIRLTHQEFGGRAAYGYDFVDDDTTAADCHGHGTHVAGTVAGATYGVAKAVEVVAVRVLDCENSGTTADVLAGYEWVAENAILPAVANVSIGGSASDTKDAAVRGMVDAGVTVAVSAGNSNTDACLQSPAREPLMLTVAATTNTDARWASSNYGTCVDLFAPGAAIISAGLASDTATASWSGTSMAAPHVTGAAALYLADNPTATPAQVSAALLAAVSTGKVTSPGTGSPNKLLYSLF